MSESKGRQATKTPTPLGQMRLTHSSKEKEEPLEKMRCKECRKRCSRRRRWQVFCSTKCRMKFNQRERRAALDLYRQNQASRVKG